ncbi:MAG: hypothetical protein JST86_06575 [Bacteroidetes bacterium]|nr:hypothetical protein [Bacteroidota bacterium]
MPVQINEVVIKLEVDNTASNASTPAKPQANKTASIREKELAAMVLDIIKEKKER